MGEPRFRLAGHSNEQWRGFEYVEGRSPKKTLRSFKSSFLV